MGTSVNKASPLTPSWSIPRAILGRSDIDINRQSQELWKAALSDRDGVLLNELAQPTIGQICMVANKKINPIDAVKEFDNIISRTGRASLVFDIAKRALVRSISNSTGSVGFASELFSEVVSYYASRDLPSFIGKHGRISSPIESIKLKRMLRENVKSYATSIKPRTDRKGWKDYVKKVTDRMVRGGIMK